MEGAEPIGTMPPTDLAIGELPPFQRENLTKEETETIYTARAILEGLMKREREADADHGPEGADAGNPEPEPEGEAKEEFYDTTPVKTGLAFSFGAEESPLIKIAKGIEDEEKALWESKSAEIMKSIMPEILDEATTFLSRIWEGGLGDVIRESLESSGSNVSAIETSKTLAKTKRTFDDYMNQLNTVLIERGNTQMILDTALKARQVQHKAVTVIQSKIESIISLKMVPG